MLENDIFCIVQEGLFIDHLGKRWLPPRKSKHKVGERLKVVKNPIYGVTLNGKQFIIVKDSEIWMEA